VWKAERDQGLVSEGAFLCWLAGRRRVISYGLTSRMRCGQKNIGLFEELHQGIADELRDVEAGGLSQGFQVGVLVRSDGDGDAGGLGAVSDADAVVHRAYDQYVIGLERCQGGGLSGSPFG